MVVFWDMQRGAAYGRLSLPKRASPTPRTDPRNLFSGMCLCGRGFRAPSMQTSPRASRCGGLRGKGFQGWISGVTAVVSRATTFFSPLTRILCDCPAQRQFLGGLRPARLTGGAESVKKKKSAD